MNKHLLTFRASSLAALAAAALVALAASGCSASPASSTSDGGSFFNLGDDLS